MSLDEIRVEALQLSRYDMQRLADSLSMKIKEMAKESQRSLCSENGKRYIQVMNEIIHGNILSNKRDADIVWGRNFVVWQLLEDGINGYIISKMFRRNPTTIYYIRDRVADAMAHPAFYPEEIKLYEEFKKAII